MTASPAIGSGSAIQILDPVHTQLLRTLDAVFTGWATDIGAAELLPPPLYDVADLDRFDVYQNFPHLALVASPLVAESVPADGNRAFEAGRLGTARFGLSTATCFGAYLYFAGRAVSPETTVTLVNRCFRNEQKFEGLRRLVSFQMREIVALGSREHAGRLLTAFTERIVRFAADLSIDLTVVAASDPFFQQDGSRALLQKLSPVKHEFQHRSGLAISSVNMHRNFFGERCEITDAATGEHVFTSCVAFGLERWVSVLVEESGGDPAAALARLRDVTGAGSGGAP
ncbi:hypothetical protein [Nocardia sp. BMG51109]|uniref:hypothetical protein n=1 Tax=Nocardia sp. BMG51109 TaxID=1056816 RepID=UPI000463EDB8|nr:hypothetical protein [Nocardia sp. BMG51109]